MSVPNVLLLNYWSPGFAHAGTVIFKDLIQHYPKGKIFCFALSPDFNKHYPNEFAGAPVFYTINPRVIRIKRFGTCFANLSCFIQNQYIKHISISKLIDQAVQFGRRNKVEIVWAVLHTPSLIYMAKRVARLLDAELVTTVTDPPERFPFASWLAIDTVSYKSVLRIFDDTLRTSTRCGVMSETMQEEYREKYGVETIIMNHGVHPSLKQRPSPNLTSDDSFTIGFAGSLYAEKEWQALVSALSSVNWKIEERNVKIIVLGSTFTINTQDKLRIEHLGWRSLEEVVKILSKVDINYLPYWFDESYKTSVKLCFPTKMATYVAAGRPILYHGPEDSSPTYFLQRFPIGIGCHSLKESDIINCLQRFIVDKDFYVNASQKTEEVFYKKLNHQVYLNQFAKLIGISSDELLSL